MTDSTSKPINYSSIPPSSNNIVDDNGNGTLSFMAFLRNLSNRTGGNKGIDGTYLQGTVNNISTQIITLTALVNSYADSFTIMRGNIDQLNHLVSDLVNFKNNAIIERNNSDLINIMNETSNLQLSRYISGINQVSTTTPTST